MDFSSCSRTLRLCPHLHLPLQSGSDTVLKRMIRRCRIQSFAQLLSDARAAHPDMNVTTDLIVGFPGETEQSFKRHLKPLSVFDLETCTSFATLPCGDSRIRLPNPVAPETIKQRHPTFSNAICTSAQNIGLQWSTKYIPCLWERDVSVLDTGDYSGVGTRTTMSVCPAKQMQSSVFSINAPSHRSQDTMIEALLVPPLPE